MDEMYADAVGRIERLNGVVKLDLVSFVPGTRDEAGRHGAEVRARLVLHPMGLAALHRSMRDLFAEIDRAGLIRAEDSQPRLVSPE